MPSNKQVLQKRYSNAIKEDERSKLSRAHGLEFHYTKKLLSQYIDRSTSVIEIGCGTGYYGVHFAEKCKEYVGVDMSPECIALFNEKIAKNQYCNVKAIVGNATRLEAISDACFDVVMTLGPMYHLSNEERKLVFEESKRICRKDGMLFYAYISKIGVYVKGCLEYPHKYPNIQTNESVLKNGNDDIRVDEFYYMMPEEIEEEATSHDLRIVRNVGVDFVFNERLINEMNQDQFEAWMVLADHLFMSRVCTGLSNHTVLVCKK